MGKLLRVLVVLLFLLGIAALALGILLFQKRETLKGHVQDLAVNVVRLSSFIEAEQDPDLTKSDLPKMDKQLEVGQLLTYKADPNAIVVDTNKPATMSAAMGLLIGKAQNQLTILNDTRSALGQKIQELEVATNRINALEADVARLEGEKKQLQDTVATLEKDVADKKAKIEELNAAIEEAKASIEDLKSQVEKLKDTMRDKDDEIKSLKSTIDRLMQEKSGPTTNAVGNLTPGTKGKILLVNTNWNFMVIGMTPNAALGVGVELTIQREDKMIGKVRVSDVNEQYQLAIADMLLAPWKQADPEVGDNVFY
jgi:uncharacterized protein YoxC